MSFYTDTRDAIASAIAAGDPSAPAENIHKRFRNPRNLTYAKLEELFGSQDTHGKILRGYMLTREAMPEEVDIAHNSGDRIVSSVSVWKIKGFLTFRDDDSSYTETTFQELVDSLHDAFWSTDAVQALAQSHDTYLQSASVDFAGLSWIDNTNLAHTIDITLRFERRGYLPD